MLISQQPGSGASYYLTDGQLSIRHLAYTAGAVTDTYVFDAFCVLLASTGSTPNVYLYAGEQFDPNVGFYYLRARYYQQSTGRSLTDPELGSVFEPASLHRYLYAHGDPVSFRDPTGRFESRANLTFTSGTAISVGAGILTMVGTHALGVAGLAQPGTVCKRPWRAISGRGYASTSSPT
jgi:RHS repeat-associated protein